MLKKMSLCAIASCALSSVAFADHIDFAGLVSVTASDLTITNNTLYPSTTSLTMPNGRTFCSTQLLGPQQGVTPAGGVNKIDSGKLVALCGSMGTCKAVVYVTKSGTPNCDVGGTAIATAVFSSSAGLVDSTNIPNEFNYKLIKVNNNPFDLALGN